MDTADTTTRPHAKPEIWRPLFLKELERTSNVSRAAKKAGVHRNSAYHARDESPEFAQAWDDAIEIGLDAVEEVAIRRAKTGQSDVLIQFILKTRRRAVYGDRSTLQIGGTDGGPLLIAYVNDWRHEQSDSPAPDDSPSLPAYGPATCTE